jgi:hypothetical protein
MKSQNSMIGRLCAGWKRFGRRIGDLQARLLLSGFYFLVAAPFALILKASSDPLSIGPKTPRGWQQLRPTPPGSAVERARRQF